MGKRTSIYLSDGLAAAVEASGVPLAELIRRGLTVATAAPGGHPGAPSRVPAADRGERRPARARCPHPGTRMIGGWCGPCGVVVEPGGYLPA